jgi:hypothetical protein
MLCTKSVVRSASMQCRERMELYLNSSICLVAWCLMKHWCNITFTSTLLSWHLLEIIRSQWQNWTREVPNMKQDIQPIVHGNTQPKAETARYWTDNGQNIFHRSKILKYKRHASREHNLPRPAVWKIMGKRFIVNVTILFFIKASQKKKTLFGTIFSCSERVLSLSQLLLRVLAAMHAHCYFTPCSHVRVSCAGMSHFIQGQTTVRLN